MLFPDATLDTVTPLKTQKANSQLPQVLVVEDEREIRELISLHLLRQGYEVHEADNAEDGLKQIRAHKFDLLILDWMLPQASGVDIVRALRIADATSYLPVLMVTAKGEPADIVMGLEAGADDYLTKPFEPAVLTARVKALLRRTPKVETEKSSRQLEIGGLILNFDTYEARCGEEALQLTPSEFKLLGTLVANAGRVLTRDRLVQEIQGEGISVVGRTIDTHVFGLRKKMGPCADLIETIRGVGYRVKAL